jgi:hypothetical protein
MYNYVLKLMIRKNIFSEKYLMPKKMNDKMRSALHQFENKHPHH